MKCRETRTQIGFWRIAEEALGASARRDSENKVQDVAAQHPHPSANRQKYCNDARTSFFAQTDPMPRKGQVGEAGWRLRALIYSPPPAPGRAAKLPVSSL
jgi:hypothetical protein